MAKKDIDLKPTEGMKKAAQRGLDLRSEHGRGGTDVGIARARDIVNGKNLSPSTVKRMFSFFSRHEGNKKAKGFRQGEEGYPSNGLIAWLLWGGDPGFSWSKKKRDQLERAEKNESVVKENQRVKGGQRVFTNKPDLSLTDEGLNQKIQEIINDMSDDDIEKLGAEDAYELAREYAYKLIQIEQTEEMTEFFKDLKKNQELRARFNTNNARIANFVFENNLMSGKFLPSRLARHLKYVLNILPESEKDVAEFEGYIHANRLVILMEHEDIEAVFEIFKVDDNGNMVRWSDH